MKKRLDNMILLTESVVGIFCCCIFPITSVSIATLIEIADWARLIIILVGAVLPCILISPILILMEQIAGYYECKDCKERYVPSYWSVFYAPHFGRTRYMKCPKCGKKSWQKKVLDLYDDKN